MSSFDELALAYDRVIDWEKRLQREIPFLVDSLLEIAEPRVLDIACGSGRHSVALAKRGARVTGFDNSKEMIQAAKELAEQNGVSTKFFLADMTDFAEMVRDEFDLVVCLGNSLALLPNTDALTRLLTEVHSLLDKNGRFAFQVLNFQEIVSTGFRVFPMKTGVTEYGEEVVFSRFYDHSGSSTHSKLILTSHVKEGENWRVVSNSLDVLRLDKPTVSQSLSAAGFSDFQLFGDYQESSFSGTSDRNIVVRAHR
ncbi:MAG: class I SAM-dependent methyltransferase [Candidatus Thorarchaeota archaeon]|nr:MAG: class I SAM-dependent methyltransferase [Candidatus Thorarchaeota archaeon]